jgi:hypothetical protein
MGPNCYDILTKDNDTFGEYSEYGMVIIFRDRYVRLVFCNIDKVEEDGRERCLQEGVTEQHFSITTS